MSLKERLLKYVAGFIYLVAGVFLVCGALIGIFIYMSPPCLEEGALAKARSVTNSEWAQIYNDAMVLLEDKSVHRYDLESLPESIARLKPINVTSQGSSLWLYLSTCGLDSKVIVFIRNSETSSQEIVLGWGDPQKSTELWTMPNNATKSIPGAKSAARL